MGRGSSDEDTALDLPAVTATPLPTQQRFNADGGYLTTLTAATAELYHPFNPLFDEPSDDLMRAHVARLADELYYVDTYAYTPKHQRLFSPCLVDRDKCVSHGKWLFDSRYCVGVQLASLQEVRALEPLSEATMGRRWIQQLTQGPAGLFEPYGLFSERQPYLVQWLDKKDARTVLGFSLFYGAAEFESRINLCLVFASKSASPSCWVCALYHGGSTTLLPAFPLPCPTHPQLSALALSPRSSVPLVGSSLQLSPSARSSA